MNVAVAVLAVIALVAVFIWALATTIAVMARAWGLTPLESAALLVMATFILGSPRFGGSNR